MHNLIIGFYCFIVTIMFITKKIITLKNKNISINTIVIMFISYFIFFKPEIIKSLSAVNFVTESIYYYIILYVTMSTCYFIYVKKH